VICRQPTSNLILQLSGLQVGRRPRDQRPDLRDDQVDGGGHLRLVAAVEATVNEAMATKLVQVEQAEAVAAAEACLFVGLHEPATASLQ